jgi:TIR domain
MPPEEPHSLVVVSLELADLPESNTVKTATNGEVAIQCHGERIFPAKEFVRVSWYTGAESMPKDYKPILGGIVFAYKPSLAGSSSFSKLHLTKRGDRYTWRDVARRGGLMYAMVLPRGFTIVKPHPVPTEVKPFDGRVALFWLLYPPKENESASVEIEWSLGRLAQDIDKEVELLNRQISFASKRTEATDYDVALSFAGEDRGYVEKVAVELVNIGVKVFYDTYEQADLWGANLYDHLSEVYQKRARFTVMFISKWYSEKLWTKFERQAAQARALGESREYILPARFDETELPGMLRTTSYVSLKDTSPSTLAQLILKKLESAPT